MLLRERDDLPETEVDLNREFYFCLLSASRELDEEIAPLYESNNQPDPDDERRSRRESKRPDFQWVYLDRFERDPNRSSKQFVVECKRLGSPPRSDWVLNSNYVEHGIIRFINPDWGYAQRFSTGAMIGYWQSMELENILTEVNEATKKRGIPFVVLFQAGLLLDSVSKLGHTLNRPFAISPFELLHRWVDLRGKCIPPTKKKSAISKSHSRT